MWINCRHAHPSSCQPCIIITGLIGHGPRHRHGQELRQEGVIARAKTMKVVCSCGGESSPPTNNTHISLSLSSFQSTDEAPTEDEDPANLVIVRPYFPLYAELCGIKGDKGLFLPQHLPHFNPSRVPCGIFVPASFCWLVFLQTKHEGYFFLTLNPLGQSL